MSTILLSIASELRRTVRSLLRHPAFTAAAVVTLALGIGATTAIFSVVYGVLIKPLPYPDADRLVSVRHTAPGLAAGLHRNRGQHVRRPTSKRTASSSSSALGARRRDTR